MTEATAPQSIAPPDPKKRTRVVSEVRVPVYSMADSLAVAKAIHEKGGGGATNDQLAAFLGYKSANNGSYLSRVSSARIFDFITGAGTLTITPRAQSILMPVYQTEVKRALVKSFLDVPLYKAVYDEYFGKELPMPFGMANAFKTRFSVPPSRIEPGLRALMDSAEQAGFFEVRGSRTQLIVPNMSPPLAKPEVELDVENHASEHRVGGGGGGGRDEHPPSVPKSAADLKNEYISTLIGVLREKGGSGDMDEVLMARIEKLLGLPD